MSSRGGEEFGTEGGVGAEPGLGDRGVIGSREQRAQEAEAESEVEAETETSSAESASAFHAIYFDYDASILKPEARKNLRHNAEVLKANPAVGVRIEGHCDERGSNEYNLALGQRRAEAAMRFLVDLGIDASRVDVISYGEENPADPASTEAAWRLNRRDEFTPR